MTAAWDPGHYARFDAERDRPARDLIARLPDDFDPREIWDLGCGPGGQAKALAVRYPEARVHGLDSSADMLERARIDAPEIDWVEGDIAAWTPARPADLIFSNAALHWVGDHPTLMPRLMAGLTPGGVLAVQMPISQVTAHHAALNAVATNGPWAETVAGLSGVRALMPTEAYYDVLAPLSERVDIWSTTYLHVLSGADPVLEWMKGAALRPYLARLSDPALRAGFLSALAKALSDAYPARADGTTLLPFPRLFVVARRP